MVRAPKQSGQAVAVVVVGIGAIVSTIVGGCAPLPPSPICVRYVACQQAFDDAAGLDPVDVAAYDVDGSCWATAEFAARCDLECTDAVASLRAASDAAELRVDECAAAD